MPPSTGCAQLLFEVFGPGSARRPRTFPADPFLQTLAEEVPGLPVIGGMVSGSRGRGGSRLLLDGAMVADGAVGALIGPGVEVETLVSQGCRPVGVPYVVTGGHGQFISELAGRTPLDRLDELAAGLPADDRARRSTAPWTAPRTGDQRSTRPPSAVATSSCAT